MRAGRVCLTDLCRAGETDSGNPIRYRDWFESDATQRFLLHRSAVTGNEVLSISPAIDNAENPALIIRENQRGDAWGDEVGPWMGLPHQRTFQGDHLAMVPGGDRIGLRGSR